MNVFIKSAIAAILFSVFISCETKPTAPKADNPFDRLNPETSGDPFNLSASIADGGIRLEWSFPGYDKLSAYKIYRSESENTGYSAIATLNKDKASYTDRFIQNGHSYWYHVTAVNINNKESGITNTVGVNIQTEPLLVINGGDEYTPSREVQLTIIAADAEQIMLSNNNDFSNAVWEEYNTTKNWTLSVNDGTKNVYIKVKYKNGNESEAVSSQIILDTTPPSIIISVTPDSGITNETEFQIDPTQSSDNLSPAESLLVRYDYENDGIFDTEWLHPSVISHQYSVGGGNKTIRMQLSDSAWKIDTLINIFVNTYPQASFTSTVDSNNFRIYHFNASASSDYEDVKNLEYRWDFDGDGTWDSGWLIQDTISYNYVTGGDEYYVKLSVRDKNYLSNEMVMHLIISLTDIDGNVYKIVKIGNQWWMAENLKVTHYRDGGFIQHVTNGDTWQTLTVGAYCSYNNDDNNISTYGLLYNWYALNGSRTIAPVGWHIPSDEEWKEMEIYLGMSRSDADSENPYGRGEDEGGKLKYSGTFYWRSPNAGATNESGFSALPGGLRDYYYGAFREIGDAAYFWTIDGYNDGSAWYRSLNYNNALIVREYYYKQLGLSVRCVRNQ